MGIILKIAGLWPLAAKKCRTLFYFTLFRTIFFGDYKMDHVLSKKTQA